MLGHFFQIAPIPEAALSGYYNPYLVALSFIIAVLASYVALEIAGLLRHRSVDEPFGWLLFCGAFAMGAGIFSMHFIGMIAFIMPMNISYDFVLTALSLVVAIVASLTALLIIRRKFIGVWRFTVVGIIFGIAIISMHYTGMTAMNGVTISYRPFLFILSVVVAIGASLIALWFMLLCDKKIGSTQVAYKIISALIMGGAICGMHYIGMEAAIITPLDVKALSTQRFLLTPEKLSFIVAIFSSLIMIVILITTGYRHLITVKLFTGNIVKVLLIVSVAIVISKNVRENRNYVDTISHQIFPRYKALLEMDRVIHQMQTELRNLEWLPEKDQNVQIAILYFQRLELEKWSHQYFLYIPPEKNTLFPLKEMTNLIEQFEMTATAVKNLATEKHTPEEIKTLVTKLSDIQKELSSVIKKAQSIETELLNENFTRFMSNSIEGSVLAIFLIISFIIFSIIISWYLSLQISKPIIEIRNIAKKIAQGDLGQKVQVSNEDEIGQLAHSFNQMVESLSHAKKNMHLISDLGKLLPTCASEEEVYLVFSQYGSKLLSRFSGALYVLGNNKNTLKLVSGWGEFFSMRGSESMANDCWAIRQGQPFTSSLHLSELRCKHLNDISGGYLCTPLAAGGEVLGIMTLVFGLLEPSTEEMKVITRVANDVALAISNVKLRHSLQELSIHDPLTDLYNRRYMEEAFSQEVGKALRKKTSLCALMFDLDGFKGVNDKFGHVAGDIVLKEFGHLLKTFFRDTDIVCRYGGEEFIVILPETSKELGLQRAEELRAKVKTFYVEIGDRTLKNITISCGMAVFPENGKTAADIIKEADAALYKAKGQGKDCVVVAE